MPYVLRQKKLEIFPTYVFFKDVFTKDECAAVIALREKVIISEATLFGNAQDKKIRSSNTGWIPWSTEVDWLYKKLSDIVDSVCLNWYPFHLSSFSEPLQLTQYLASEGGHYSMHKDLGDNEHSVRKLSLVLLLSGRDGFEGGDLEFLATPGEDKRVAELEQGTVIAFPSWELHRVTPVTKGERWSLVSWVHGPAFV